MSLTTVEDFEIRLGEDFTAEQAAQVQSLIKGIESDLSFRTKIRLDSRTVVDEPHRVYVDVSEEQRHWWVEPHHRPVLSVQGVTFDGDVLPSGQWTIENNAVVISPTTPLGVGGVSTIQYQGYSVLLSYTGGGGRHAATLWGLAMDRIERNVVKRVLDKAAAVTTLNQEGYGATYLTEGWTDQELQVIANLRRPTVV